MYTWAGIWTVGLLINVVTYVHPLWGDGGYIERERGLDLIYMVCTWGSLMVECQYVKLEAHSSNLSPGTNFSLKYINFSLSDSCWWYKNLHHKHELVYLLFPFVPFFCLFVPFCCDVFYLSAKVAAVVDFVPLIVLVSLLKSDSISDEDAFQVHICIMKKGIIIFLIYNYEIKIVKIISHDAVVWMSHTTIFLAV